MDNSQNATLRFIPWDPGYLAIYADDTTWEDDGPLTVFEITVPDVDLGCLSIHFENGVPKTIGLDLSQIYPIY